MFAKLTQKRPATPPPPPPPPPLPEPISFIDTIPIASQLKSTVQALSGNIQGAKSTQDKFTRNNIYIAPIRYGVELAMGDTDSAQATHTQYAHGLDGMMDSVPIIGHIKGAMHYVNGDTDRGDHCMKSASRMTVVMGAAAAATVLTAGTAIAATPVMVSVAAAVTAGAAMDTITTTIDTAVSGQFKPSGTISAFKNVVDDVNQGRDCTGSMLHAVLVPATDAITGISVHQAVNHVIHTPHHRGMVGQQVQDQLNNVGKEIQTTIVSDKAKAFLIEKTRSQSKDDLGQSQSKPSISLFRPKQQDMPVKDTKKRAENSVKDTKKKADKSVKDKNSKDKQDTAKKPRKFWAWFCFWKKRNDPESKNIKANKKQSKQSIK